MDANLQDQLSARWDDVRIFLAAYRHKSFGTGGRRLGVDTSTVSRRVTALEQSLGVRLFERLREGLAPTRVAELIFEAAEAMEVAFVRIAREASGVETAAEGIVRVSADPGVASIFVAPLLARLRDQHPGIDVELDTSVRALDLTRREADLAVRSVHLQGSDLVVTKLTTSRWIAAASPGLLKRLGRVSAWDDLPWITWDRDFGSFPPAKWVGAHARNARIALRSSNFNCQLAAARAGLGVGLFPVLFVRAFALEAVPFSRGLAASATLWPTDDLWLAGHRALREIPRVAAVWEFLAAELRKSLRD